MTDLPDHIKKERDRLAIDNKNLCLEVWVSDGIEKVNAVAGSAWESYKKAFSACWPLSQEEIALWHDKYQLLRLDHIASVKENESLRRENELAKRRLGPGGWKILKEHRALKEENEVLKEGLAKYDCGYVLAPAGHPKRHSPTCHKCNTLARADKIREGK